jgi:RNA polymerase sigma-70 factor (ECF subfamily)
LKKPSQITELERLFEQFHGVLVAYAYGFLKSPEDAKEIVQDVFISVWNNRERLQLESDLKAYLYAATKNKCLNFIQKRKLPTVSLNIATADANTDYNPEAELEVAELRAEIFDEVSKLPVKCREIFILSRQDGMSHKKIAQYLGISEKTVENQIGIALKRIRQRLYGKKQG